MTTTPETTSNTAGTISPDGMWAWNGTEWRPNSAFAAAPIPPKKKHLGLKIAGGVVAAIVAMSIVGGAGDDPASAEDATQASNSQSAQDAPAEDAPAEETVPGINDVVRDGKFEFTVTGIEDGVAEVGDEYFGETAQGSYTLVTMTVENIGDEAQSFFSENITATDSQGRELSSDSMASFYATKDGEAAFYEEVNPGNGITVTIAFDVAKGESMETITLHDSAFSGGVTVHL